MHVYSTKAGSQFPNGWRPARDHEGVGPSAGPVGIAIWVALALLMIGAVTMTGIMVFFVFPLFGLGYPVFCLIAITGDRDAD